MKSTTIIEVALNGPWGQTLQPGMPISIEDIAADGIKCARAGASIIHFHAYDPVTGRQNDSGETYAKVIEIIRNQVDDVLVYPTIPLSGSTLSGSVASPESRFTHIEFLARQGLIEMTVVDPGSVNFARTDEALGADSGFVYLNPESHILRGLELCKLWSLRPSYAIYEPGFTRMGAHLAQQYRGLQTPLYRFMFSDLFAWGFPPKRYALNAHLELLKTVAPQAPWMIGGLGVDLRYLINDAVELGGHVRVGLEDAHFLCVDSNVTLVEQAVKMTRRAGSEPASPSEMRAMFSVSDTTQ